MPPWPHVLAIILELFYCLLLFLHDYLVDVAVTAKGHWTLSWEEINHITKQKLILYTNTEYQINRSKLEAFVCNRQGRRLSYRHGNLGGTN